MEFTIKIRSKDIIFLVASLVIIFGMGYAIAQIPNPGHSLDQIGSGQFGEVGDYVFPGTSRVGIGGAPSEDLHVSGTGDNKIVVESSDNHAAFNFKNDHGSWILGVESNTGNARLFDEVNSEERITILPNGNVGIGKSPSEKLDVAGDVKAVNVDASGTVTGTEITSGADLIATGGVVFDYCTDGSCGAQYIDLFGGAYEGYLEPMTMCPIGFYVCGLQQRVHEDPFGDEDQMGVTDITMICCPFNPTS